jgi:putative hemolysin
MSKFLIALMVLSALMVLGVLGLAACGAGPTAAPTATEDTFQSPVELANPASKYCVDQGYRLEIRTEEAGAVGYCIFPDGTECEEWAYYREECGPGTATP